MADVGLYRAQRATARRPGAIPPQFGQTREFHRVPHRSAGGVAFDKIHLVRRPARLAIRLAQGAQLALRAGGKQIAIKVVGQTHAANHRANAVPVPQRVRQPFQHDDARAFADDQPAGRHIEGGAPAARGQGAQLAKTHLRVQRIGPGEPAREHDIRPAGQQLVARLFDRVQGGSARGVQRVAASAQPQPARQQTRGQARDIAIQRLGPQLRRGLRPAEEPLLEERHQHAFAPGRGGGGGQGDIAQHQARAAAIHGRHLRVAPRIAAGR